MSYDELKSKYPDLNWSEADEVSQEDLEAAAQKLDDVNAKIFYKGYTIEEEDDPWMIKYGSLFFFYPTAQGIQDDADYDGDRYVYCGNRRWAGSIQEANDMIDELVDE